MDDVGLAIRGPCMGLDGTGLLRAHDFDGINGKHGHQRRWWLHRRHMCRFIVARRARTAFAIVSLGFRNGIGIGTSISSGARLILTRAFVFVYKLHYYV